MSTIDDQRPVHEVQPARPTVRQAHRMVGVARLSRCRHGRARPVHRSRHARRPPVSQYRPADFSYAPAEPASTRTGLRRRHAVPTAAIATVALSLLCVGIIRVLDPNLNTRVLVLGVFLIAVTAAVCLNASALDAMAPPAGVRHRPSPTAAARRSAAGLRDSEPDNSRSNDE